MTRFYVTYVIPNYPWHPGVGGHLFDTEEEAKKFAEEQTAKGMHWVEIREWKQ